MSSQFLRPLIHQGALAVVVALVSIVCILGAPVFWTLESLRRSRLSAEERAIERDRRRTARLMRSHGY